MSNILDKSQIEDLLEYCGTTPTFWRQNDMLVCCPVHGESNPSMGVSADKQVCHCFSCGFAGGFEKLLYMSLPEEFGYSPYKPNTEYKAYRKAVEFLDERYEREVRVLSDRVVNVKRYEDTLKPKRSKTEERVILPKWKLAPFMSGKETFGYFFNRGFNIDDMKEFMIGRDLESKTVTIPIFYDNGDLAGVIGRYISKNRKHNERYKIYSFERGNLLYPMNLVDLSCDCIILVEGNFDAIRMFKCGYRNTLSIMSNDLTDTQARILCKLSKPVIYVGDNDKRGIEGRDKNIKKLKKFGVKVKTVKYPEYGKDPCDWTDNDIHTMIESASGSIIKVQRIR